MSGSESKSERETNGSSQSEADRPSLADFLAAPRPRSSIPAPRRAAESAEEAASAEAAETDLPSLKREESEITTEAAAAPSATIASQDAATLSADASASAADATTPTAPTASSEPPPAATTATARPATESRSSLAPASGTDAAARSLIPVATSDTSDEERDRDLDEDFALPGAGPPWSSATIRRVTYVALLAAAAAVPAWVVFRARSVDVQARTDNAAQKAAAAAGPSTLQPTRVIEGDEQAEAIAEPAPSLVALDPTKAAEVRREARRLLEAGIIEPGVAAARSAIALNPADPEAYVLLAAGLQDMGRWAESREVFSRCVHKSKNGINAECAYFANSGTITNR
jgi:hypothetical protein